MLNDEGKSALSRRAFVGRLAAGAAVTLAAGMGPAKAMSPREQTLPGPESASNAGKDVGALGREPQAKADEVTSRSDAPPRVEPSMETSSGPPPWELLSPLAPGSKLGHGWRVAGLSGIEHGSCVLTLQNQRGRTHRVHLCRNDGRPQGLVYTEQLDLVVMNGGLGDLPTEEGLAQAVAKVAHVLAANEGDRRHQVVVTALLPQAERVNLFAAAAALR